MMRRREGKSRVASRAKRHVEQANKPPVKNPQPPEILLNYREDIGYRGAVIYERTGVMPKNVQEILDYDQLLENDIGMWLELFKFYRG